jgi:hypothetical protein
MIVIKGRSVDLNSIHLLQVRDLDLLNLNTVLYIPSSWSKSSHIESLLGKSEYFIHVLES